MEPIFETMPGLSEGDISAARSLLDLMLAGKRVDDNPVYKTFCLPESGLKFTPEWFLAKGGQAILVWDKVSLISLAKGDEGNVLVRLATLQRVPDPEPVPVIEPEPMPEDVPVAADPETIQELSPPEVVLRTETSDMSFWSTLVFWGMFLISWMVFGLSCLLKALK
jgi:hypothetical protein